MTINKLATPAGIWAALITLAITLAGINEYSCIYIHGLASGCSSNPNTYAMFPNYFLLLLQDIPIGRIFQFFVLVAIGSLVVLLMARIPSLQKQGAWRAILAIILYVVWSAIFDVIVIFTYFSGVLRMQ
jgi:hypothetical protein